MVRELFRSNLPEVGLTARERGRVWVGLVVLVIVVGAGLFGVVQIAEQGLERDLVTWRVRLSLVAESRAAAVETWLGRHTKAIGSIADNTSVRLYATQLAMTGSVGGAPAQRQYLVNLLNVTADREGFASSGVASRVPANLPSPRNAGVAIVAADGSTLATTRHMPDVQDLISSRDQTAPTVIFDTGAGRPEPLLLFFAPIYSVQADTERDAPIAWVVGARTLGTDLFEVLRQPGDLSRSGETYLAEVTEDKVRHLSPLAGLDGAELPDDILDIDGAARFVASGRSGMEQALDYSGSPVLAAGRNISGPLGWSLVRTVQADEALAEIVARRNTMLTVLGLSVLAVAALILLVWRHGASVRAAAAARQIAHAATEYEKLSGFLEVVTNSQPTSILVVDADGGIIMANQTAAKEADMEADEMRGKNLVSVFGSAIARPVLSAVKAAKAANGGVAGKMISLDDDSRILKADLVPLALGDEGPPATLIVIEDMSELMAARARRESSLKGLVQLVVALIDARDPYSARHSTHVAEIARIIAEEMRLEPVTVETVETAGALLNLGKLTVSKDILTRPDHLSADEIEQVRRAMQQSAELVQHLDFDGPVAETLRQHQSNWDGSGSPDKSGGLARDISGDEILISARILAVANAFVAMLSPRAHRPGLDVDTVIHTLLEGAEKAYDRKVVAALVHYLDNEGGRSRWEELSSRSAPAIAPLD